MKLSKTKLNNDQLKDILNNHRSDTAEIIHKYSELIAGIIFSLRTNEMMDTKDGKVALVAGSFAIGYMTALKELEQENELG